MKSNVLSMPDQRSWRELASFDGRGSTLSIYVCSDGTIDIVQVNDDGESITSMLSLAEAEKLVSTISSLAK